MGTAASLSMQVSIMYARQILSGSLAGNLMCLAYWSLKSYRENNVRALDATVLIADIWTLELPCVIVHAHKQNIRDWKEHSLCHLYQLPIHARILPST